MRPAHILKANHSLASPQDCIWFDTETTAQTVECGVERQILWFGYAAQRRRIRDGEWSAPDWLRFESAAYFWDWVESKLHGKCRLYIFAHNVSFDAPVVDMFGILPDRGWELIKAVIDSPPTLLTWRRGDQTIQVVDTLNIWRMPLAGIGKQIGLEKLPMPRRNASRAKWEAYGKRDTEIIMEACLRWFAFLKQEKLGGFAPTLASQAMRAFRHRFMLQHIYIDADKRALELSREALHGGRTECFYIGKKRGKFYQLDVNSMYPWIMQKYDVPVKLVGCYSDVTRAELARWLKRYCVVARVRLVTDEPAYAVVHDNRLVFPVGKLRVALCTPELIYALSKGHIHSVEVAAVYERARVFAPFVTTLYGLRLKAAKAGDAVASWLYKILMNSLYGKFAQRGRSYEAIGHTDPKNVRAWVEVDADSGDVFRYREFAGLIQLRQDEGESFDSFPALAAHVTAYARCRFYELMRAAGAGHYLYGDTDCLLVDAFGYKRLKRFCNATRLGGLKLEAQYRFIHIRSPKDYRFDDKEKVKGVKRSAVWIDAETVEQYNFSSLRGLIARGDLSAPIITKVRKRLRRIYTKATVAADGNCSPLRLNHW